MQRSTLITGAVLAGALGLGLAATPVLAAQFTTTGTTAASGANGTGTPMGGMRWGSGATTTADTPMGMGYRGGGVAGGTGDCPCVDGSTAPSGTLTDAQSAALAGMAEEEKLAHDVYVALAASTGDVRFTRVASAESQHLSAVRTMLTRYGISDPTAGLADGHFATAAVQSSYDQLVAQGKVSATAALQVGQAIEKLDIADLDKAGSGLDAADVTAVYAHLRAASQQHLAIFGG